MMACDERGERRPPPISFLRLAPVDIKAGFRHLLDVVSPEEQDENEQYQLFPRCGSSA